MIKSCRKKYVFQSVGIFFLYCFILATTHIGVASFGISFAAAMFFLLTSCLIQPITNLAESLNSDDDATVLYIVLLFLNVAFAWLIYYFSLKAYNMYFDSDETENAIGEGLTYLLLLIITVFISFRPLVHSMVLYYKKHCKKKDMQ